LRHNSESGQSMVKAVAFFKRRAGMDVEEFQAYWL
jgi:hypothetical protein